MSVHPRRRKLIRPGLQLRLIFLFASIASFSLLLHQLLLFRRLAKLAALAPDGGNWIVGRMPQFVYEDLLVSVAVLVGITFLVGLHETFRIAGPVYRFERFLEAVMGGSESGECRIRKGDEFQGLCSLINQATRAQRDLNMRDLPEENAPAMKKSA